MNEHYVVKDLVTNKYYKGYNGEEWDDDIITAYWFDLETTAQDFISREEGIFTIIKIYRP